MAARARPPACAVPPTATTWAARPSPRKGHPHAPAAPTTPTAPNAARRVTCRPTAPSPARRATHPACSTTTPATTTPLWARSSRRIRSCPTRVGLLTTIAFSMRAAIRSSTRIRRDIALLARVGYKSSLTYMDDHPIIATVLTDSFRLWSPVVVPVDPGRATIGSGIRQQRS